MVEKSIVCLGDGVGTRICTLGVGTGTVIGLIVLSSIFGLSWLNVSAICARSILVSVQKLMNGDTCNEF